jgi:hypothetical protein
VFAARLAQVHVAIHQAGQTDQLAHVSRSRYITLSVFLSVRESKSWLRLGRVTQQKRQSAP